MSRLVAEPPPRLDRVRRRVRRLTAAGTLGRASVLMALGSGGGRAIGLVAALIGAAALGPHQYGVFAFLALTATVLSSLGVLGFGPIVTRSVAAAEGQRERGILATSALALSVVLLVGWCLLFLGVTGGVGAVSWLAGYEHLRGSGALAVVAWTLGLGVAALVSAVYAGHQRFGAVMGFGVVRAAVVGAASVGPAVMTGSAVATATAAGLAELLCAAGGVAALQLRDAWARVGRSDFAAAASTLARGGIWGGVASVSILAALWYLQSLLLARPGGLADNGGFALANRLSLVVSFLPSALAVPAIAFVAATSHGAGRALGRRVVWLGLGASVVLAAVLVAAAPAVVAVFGYTAYTPAVMIMALAGVAVSANALLGNVALGLGRVRAWIVSDLLLAAVIAVAAYPTVRGWGASGAAVCVAAGYAVSVAYLVAVLGPAWLRRGPRWLRHRRGTDAPD